MLTARTVRRALVAVMAVVMSAGSAAGQEPASLERLLAIPFAGELTASGTKGRIAWVRNVAGARNVSVAEPPAYRGRQITRFESDDGKYIGQLALASAHVFYVRGGGGGRRLSHAPNPTLDPLGRAEELWMASVAGDDLRRIDQGHSPAVSPRGDLVAYVQGNTIWGLPLEGGPPEESGPGEPFRLVAERGAVSSLRWSPDGARLAYVSSRGAHSFIAVYDVAARSLKYVDPSVGRDQEPVWSPDGTRLAFIRVPATVGGRWFAPRRTAQPWSIRLAALSSGETREVWRAAPGTGSAFWGLRGLQRLFWADGDRLVFPWERTGWVHLYAVPAHGGGVTELTPGEFEVEEATLSPDRREIIYSSNQGDLDRRHLWRVSVIGGEPSAVTAGTGLEWSPRATAVAGVIAFLASGAQAPPRVELARMAPLGTGGSGRPGREAVALMSVPALPHLPEPQAIVFPSTDGVSIRGQLFLPAPRSGPDRRPAIVFAHGGSRVQSVLGYPRSDYYQRMYAFNQYLASRGYVVLSVNYRGGTGYGMTFREAKRHGAGGASEVGDVLGAGLYLRSRDDVDPERIGVWGGSYGGFLTAMALTHGADLFAAGVDIHGVHSWLPMYNTSPYGVDDEEAIERTARWSSPLTVARRWRAPVLFVHGDDDRNVDFTQTVAMVTELRRHGVAVEVLVLPNEVHSFLLHASWLRVFRRAAEFLDRTL